ncbi:MAG: M48 family metalloprotease [Actinobacteria bacterium]|nr:M48 family metalloprotease [Actinomycetota bacterium]
MKDCRRLISMGLVLLVFAGPGCVRNPVTGKKQLRAISPGQEIAIGQNSAPEFESQMGGKVDNSKLQQYVASVGRKLAEVSDRSMPYEYALLNSDIPNAFALPGGKIYLTAGLMSQMRNERQLAAVLAHETIHVAAGHSVQGLQQQMGAAIFVELLGALVGGEGAQTAEAAAKFAGNMVLLKYSRGMESEADAYGVAYMVRAGYNPWGMVELLEVLQSLSNSNPGLFGDFFATHPLTSKRIKEVREIVKEDYSKFSPATPDPHEQDFMRMRSLLINTLKD